ncbi:hypothetical protein IG631_10415 [Alternaria alternata]|nr:hypothetical protein IG631_10415 [Alternaria alternata]
MARKVCAQCPRTTEAASHGTNRKDWCGATAAEVLGLGRKPQQPSELAARVSSIHTGWRRGWANSCPMANASSADLYRGFFRGCSLTLRVNMLILMEASAS